MQVFALSASSCEKGLHMPSFNLSKSDQLLRAGFRYFNRFMLLLWRLGLGPWLNIWPQVLSTYMVIVHKGRKSGLWRRTPVNYAIVDGEIYCVSGFGAVSDWYRNLLVNPEVEVWLPNGWWRAISEEITEPGERLQRIRQTLLASGWAAYMSILDPRGMSDAQLEEATKEYRVMHIHRMQARTGPGGPGDLAWVWPAVVHAYVLLAGLRALGRRRARDASLAAPSHHRLPAAGDPRTRRLIRPLQRRRGRHRPGRACRDCHRAHGAMAAGSAAGAYRLGHLSRAGALSANRKPHPQHGVAGRGLLPLAIAFLVYGLPKFGRTIAHSRPLWIFAFVVVLRSVTNVLATRYTMAIYVQLMTLMTPFLIALLSFFVLRERLPRGALTAMALSFVGSLLMLSSNLAGGGLHFALERSDLLGIGLALASAVFLALYMLSVRRTMTTPVSALGVLLFQSAVIFAVSITLSLLLGEDWSRWGALQPSDWVVFVIFAILILSGANALQIVALRRLGAPVVSSLMGWRLVSTLLVGMLLLGEGLQGWVQGLGMVIVLATVTWYVGREAHKTH